MKSSHLQLVMCALAGTLCAEIPKSIPHQGRIAVSGANYDGTGQFKFLLFTDPDADHASGNETALWSNSASSPPSLAEPASAVSIPVMKGLYGTWLGDSTIANMAALPTSIEPTAGSRLYLRIWFSNGVSGFQALAPDQSIAAVPFALHAAGVAAGGVTAESLAAGAITSAKLADGAVTQSKLAPGAVDSSALASDAVTGDKIAAGAVTEIGTPGQPGSIAPGPLLEARDFDQTGLGSPTSVAVSGNFAYVVDADTARLQILDVSNPDNIVAKDFDQTGMGIPRSVAVSGNFAYVVDSSTARLQIFDISDPNNIVAKDFDPTGMGSPRSVAVSGNFAYVVDVATARLQIFDVSDPNNIVAKDFDQTGLSIPRSLAVSGNLAYVVDSGTNRLQIFDVTDPNNIVAKGFDEGRLETPTSVAVSGNFAYVVDAVLDRLRIFDVSDPNNVVAKDFDQTGLVSPTSVAVSGNFAYVVDTITGRLQIFDVSDPDNIVAKGFDQTGLSVPESVAVVGNFAYVVDSGSNRLQIFSSSMQLHSPGGMFFNGDLRVAGSARVSELQVLGNENSFSANITGGLAASFLSAASANLSGTLIAGSANLSANLGAGSANVTGNLNAGSANVSGALTSGSALSGSFSLTSPKSYTLSIPGIALLPQIQGENLFRSSLGFIQQAAGADLAFAGVAAVNLPEGAVITGIDTLYYDNSAADFSNLTVRVRRVLTTATPVAEQNILATDILSPPASSSTTMIVSTNNTPDVSRAVVDNELYTYFVSLTYTVTAADANLKFYGFRIRYNVTSLTP